MPRSQGYPEQKVATKSRLPRTEGCHKVKGIFHARVLQTQGYRPHKGAHNLRVPSTQGYSQAKVASDTRVLPTQGCLPQVFYRHQITNDFIATKSRMIFIVTKSRMILSSPNHEWFYRHQITINPEFRNISVAGFDLCTGSTLQKLYHYASGGLIA